MTKSLLREKAIELRKAGLSYNFIRDRLGVSKSTLTRWLTGIPFIPGDDFIERVNRTHTQITDFRKRIKSESEKEAKELAFKDVGRLSERDLYMLGLGIYMGEGSKTVGLRIVNSDPTIVKLAITWFKKIFGLSDENFRVRIHLYPDCNRDECMKYWADATELNLNQFYPVYVDNRTNKKIRKGRKLLFGTAHVTIRSAKNRKFGILLMRRILNSIEIAKNQAGLV